MSKLLIEAENISAEYRAGESIFQNLSFEVRANENVSILGPSGSGKSTLLKILAGVKKPASGTVCRAKVEGRPLRAGLMFQQPMLLPWLTVAANIGLGDRYHRHADDHMNPAELISAVGLAGLVARRPGELSGGQRQRAALARTLAHRPDVLLLDEPFSALDVELRGSLRYLVMKLTSERNIPIVLVTHQPDEATSFGGRIVTMQELTRQSKQTVLTKVAMAHGDEINV